MSSPVRPRCLSLSRALPCACLVLRAFVACHPFILFLSWSSLTCTPSLVSYCPLQYNRYPPRSLPLSRPFDALVSPFTASSRPAVYCATSIVKQGQQTAGPYSVHIVTQPPPLTRARKTLQTAQHHVIHHATVLAAVCPRCAHRSGVRPEPRGLQHRRR